MKTLTTLCVLFALSLSLVTAQQVSDRAVVDKFSKTVRELLQAIDAAKSAQDCADISASVQELEKESAGHKELLDRALYPDDYAKTMTNLQGRLLLRQKDLGVIESQMARIAELETQVRELTGKIEALTAENEKLFATARNLQRANALNAEAAAMSTTVVDSLNLVIARLTRNLKERDNLVFALIDSLFMQYDKDVASMNDVEKQRVSVRLERRNVLTSIRQSIEDNLKFLESSGLSPKEYIEIVRQNQRFTNQWNGLKSKIAAIYLSGKQKKNEPAAIDTMLSAWTFKANQATWRGLASLLEKGGVQLEPFSSGEEFTARFAEFVGREIKNSKKESNDVQRKRFNSFADSVWQSELKPSWLPTLVQAGKITTAQKDEIEKSFNQWQSAVTPTPPLVYILGALAIVLLLWSLSRRKKK